MSSSNHPPPDPFSGGHFDLLRRATQKMMYKYVSFSIYLSSLDQHTGPSHPASASPELQTPLSRRTCSTSQTGLPCYYVLHLHYPSPWTHTHTHIHSSQFPLGPLSQMHFARSSSRTPLSAHNKVSRSAEQCVMVYTVCAFDWTLQDAIPAVLIGQAAGRSTQTSRCSPTRLAGCCSWLRLRCGDEAFFEIASQGACKAGRQPHV